MKFLFDLFPIILFFVAFKLWGIFTATAVAIVATLVQIAWVAFRHRKVDPMLWVSLGVVTIFGGATLVLHNDTFIKWKPTVLYWAFSVALIVSQLAFNKNLIEVIALLAIAAMPTGRWLGLDQLISSLVFRRRTSVPRQSART